MLKHNLRDLVVSDNMCLPLGVIILNDYTRARANSLFELVEQRLKWHFGIFLASQNQQRIDILLTIPSRSLASCVRNENDGPVVFRFPVGVGFNGRRQEIAIWIAVVVAAAMRRAADMRRNGLSRHRDPPRHR